jgi:hypothetical protein
MALDDVIFGREYMVHDIPVHAPYVGTLTDVVFVNGDDATDDIPIHTAYPGSLTGIVYTNANNYYDQGFVMHVNPRFLAPTINPMLVIRPL